MPSAASIAAAAAAVLASVARAADPIAISLQPGDWYVSVPFPLSALGLSSRGSPLTLRPQAGHRRELVHGTALPRLQCPSRPRNGEYGAVRVAGSGNRRMRQQ